MIWWCRSDPNTVLFTMTHARNTHTRPHKDSLLNLNFVKLEMLQLNASSKIVTNVFIIGVNWNKIYKMAPITSDFLTSEITRTIFFSQQNRKEIIVLFTSG